MEKEFNSIGVWSGESIKMWKVIHIVALVEACVISAVLEYSA